jgi:transcriptional regulator with XRE-family HTH domain
MDEEVKPMHLATKFNGDMLRIGRDLRGHTTRELAKLTGIKLKVLNAYCAGQEPQTEDLEKLSEVLHFPATFFYREGDYPRRDPRYPLDMYVPLPPEPLPTRQEAADLLQYIPDKEIPGLVAYMREIADYGEKVTRFPPNKKE